MVERFLRIGSSRTYFSYIVHIYIFDSVAPYRSKKI